MAAARRWLLVVAICLTVGQGLAPARSAKRPRATLVAHLGGNRTLTLVVVGGRVWGKGWVGGEAARGLAHKGDRMTLYGLKSGVIDSAELTKDGALWSEHPEGAVSEGLAYEMRLTAPSDKCKTHEGEPVIAVWHSPGAPEPRWVPAQELSPESSTYRRLAAEWVRSHGGPKEAAQQVTVGQIVRADLNGDGRDEVLLSFYWFDETLNGLPTLHTTRGVSYLIMRYLPRGSRTPRTVLLDSASTEVHAVIGLCDLDRDGWAEVVAKRDGYEYWSSRLYHWTGGKFRVIQGDVFGV